MYIFKTIKPSTICNYCEEINESITSDFCCDDCEQQYCNRLGCDDDNY